MSVQGSIGSLDVFSELKAISLLTRRSEQEAEGRERLIRFLDSYGGASAELPIVDTLCARFGLYPYMSTASPADEVTALAVEYHTPAELATRGFTFHAQQQRIYERLMDGESLILSAPTSFGKSVIVDALVASKKWNNIVLLVPTVALIDEVRRRLATLSDHYSIVTHPAQEPGQRNIYVVTQERFLELDEVPPVDFFMIDEFYKLGSAEKEQGRRALLNIAWNRLKRTGAQYYLTGPNIDSLNADIDATLLARLVKTDFKTVVVEMDDRSSIPEGAAQLADLKKFLVEEADEPNLIFVGSPKKASNLVSELDGTVPSPLTSALAEWVDENYHPEWYVSTALRRGLGIHTGPLPRSLQRAMVRLFHDGEIGTLICTSTLIEGVNTVAKNVIVFEKAIDRKPLDFFTFSNIRGRAGRMFKHFVGRIVSYSKPPSDTQTEVDIPIESQSSLASLSTLVQLDDDQLTDESRERLAPIFEQSVLSISTIRKNRGLQPELLIAAAERAHNFSRAERMRFSWSGAPKADEARAVLELGFETLLQPLQRRGMNFEMLWGRLQAARDSGGDIRSMIAAQLAYRRSDQTVSDVVEDVLKFRRRWMGFTVPAMIRGVQSVQSEILPQYGTRPGNYEYLLREIEGLYMPPNIADLEEYGLPLPVAQKLIPFGLRGESLQALLNSLLNLAASESVLGELDAVDRWFLADVVQGFTNEISPPRT